MDSICMVTIPLSPALQPRNKGVHFPHPLSPLSQHQCLQTFTNFSPNYGARLPNAVRRRSRVVPIAKSLSESVPISTVDDIVIDIPYHIIVYQGGRYEKLGGCDTVPAGIDPTSGVQSKDVIIVPDTKLSVRLYIPKTQNPNNKKLPILFYYHGGGFIIGTAAEPKLHNFLNLIAAESGALIVSVDYGTAPEHLIPTPFDDSWEAIKWAAQHIDGNGPETWLNEYADFENVFFAGESAGANISHQMAIRVGLENPTPTVNLQGIILLNPCFWGKTPVGSETKDDLFIEFMQMLWTFVSPDTTGLDDPMINPAMDPKISDLGGSKALVYVAELDHYKSRGWYYKDILDKSNWKGNVEVIEDKGVNHVYFLTNPSLESAQKMRTNISNFINNRALV